MTKTWPRHRARHDQLLVLVLDPPVSPVTSKMWYQLATHMDADLKDVLEYEKWKYWPT